jgi:adenylate cyclase class IV
MGDLVAVDPVEQRGGVRVAGLGDFIELELQASQGEVPLARAVIESLARELGCTNPERRSYLELLLAKSVPR